jgi:hypothetical protein
MEEDRRWMYEG